MGELPFKGISSSWRNGLTETLHEMLHLERNNSMHQNRLEANCLSNSFVRKNLEVLEDKLNMSQKCILMAKVINNILNYIRKNLGSRSREVLIPHLQYCRQLWVPQHNRDRHTVVSPVEGQKDYYNIGAFVM